MFNMDFWTPNADVATIPTNRFQDGSSTLMTLVIGYMLPKVQFNVDKACTRVYNVHKRSTEHPMDDRLPEVTDNVQVVESTLDLCMQIWTYPKANKPHPVRASFAMVEVCDV